MSRSGDSVEFGGLGLAFVQSIEPRGFLGLSLRHGLLNLATLTAHRFWGQSKVRRRIWGSMGLYGEPLTYVGGGRELFVGFVLKVLTIGGPLFAAALAVQAWGPLQGGLVAIAAFLTIAFVEGLGRFGAFLYTASRTEWRGVHFELHGSPLEFALAHMKDALLTLATFGWWLPVAHRRQAASLWGGLTFMGQRLGFDMAASRRRHVYSAFAIGWFATVMMLLFVGGIVLGLTSGVVLDLVSASASEVIGLFALGLALIVGLAAVWAPYQAARWSSTAAGLGFSLPICWWGMAGLNAGNATLRLLSLGILGPYVQARTSAFMLQRLSGTLWLG